MNKKQIHTPPHLKAQLESLIDRLAAQEARKKRQAHMRILWHTIGSAAACFALFIGIWHYYQPQSHQQLAFTEEEQIHMAISALEQVSLNFNEGIEQLNALSAINNENKN